MSVLWMEKTLKSVLKLEYGKPLESDYRKTNGLYPAYGANGEKTRTDKYYHDKPSIIVGRKGSAGEINLSEGKFWPLDVTYFITFDENQYDLRFLFYLLTTLNLPSLAKGVKPGINRNDVYSKRVKVPPIDEQKRIVKILDESFKAIDIAKENTEKNLHNARDLFESYLNDIFSIRRDGWIESTLDNLTTKIGSGATPKGGQNSYKTHGISLIRSLNVYDNQFRYEKLAYIDDIQAKKLSNAEVQANDILFNITGASVARCCIVPNDVLPARVNQHVSIIRPLPKIINSEFLKYLLVSKPYKNKLLLTGEEGGSTRQAITKLQLQNFSVFFPSSLTEQLNIVDQIKNIAFEIEHLESIYQKKLTALEELKKSLLHEAFNGGL